MKKNSHAKKKKLAIQKFQNDEKFECDLLNSIAYAQKKRFIGEVQGERGERFFFFKMRKGCIVINHWKLSICFMIPRNSTRLSLVAYTALPCIQLYMGPTFHASEAQFGQLLQQLKYQRHK